MTQREDRGAAGCVVGILADPEAPTKLANRLARTLPARLADGNPDLPPASIDVVSEPFTTGTEDASTLLDRIEEHAQGRGWAVTIGLTELPLHAERRHLVADVDTRTRTALVSLPALGGIRLHSAALRAVSDLVAELAADHASPADAAVSGVVGDALTGRLSPIQRGPTAGDGAADLRFVAPGARGRLRLLAGMVRTNHPWKLVPGLSKALAAALATGAIATVNSTIWSLAATTSVPRLAIAMVGSIALIVGWIIVDADLWHRAGDGSREGKEKWAMYNASTVVTVACGGLTCYAALYVINLLWAVFIVNGQAFQRTVGQPMTGGQYLTLSWLVASAATVGGALGSGLEGDEAVRAAAFGKREQERRQMLEEQRGTESAAD
jgi:hypothetical protein